MQKDTKLDAKYGVNLLQMMVQKWKKRMNQNRKEKTMKNRWKNLQKLEVKLVIKSYANLASKFDTNNDV